MSDATNVTPVAEDAHASSRVPVHDWQIDSTSAHVAIRLCAEGVSEALSPLANTASALRRSTGVHDRLVSKSTVSTE